MSNLTLSASFAERQNFFVLLIFITKKMKMKLSSSLLLLSATLLILLTSVQLAKVPQKVYGKSTVAEAEKYVTKANEDLRVQKNIIGLASWAQSSNITAENDQAYVRTL